MSQDTLYGMMLDALLSWKGKGSRAPVAPDLQISSEKTLAMREKIIQMAPKLRVDDREKLVRLIAQCAGDSVIQAYNDGCVVDLERVDIASIVKIHAFIEHKISE